MKNFITLTVYSSRTEAEVARGLLESNGIEAIISADDAGREKPYLLSYTFGVKLQVKEEDLQEAKKLLELK